MSLAPGVRLGPYEIVSPLGAGGMGEVYRARDTRLERSVAIKILPAHFSTDPVRKQRLEREAKTISSLNHPHICVLHDIGSQDGIDYLVMECVEGETLAKRLEKGPLPLEQVLKYGAQISDALDKAHRSGVVHRDLKPGNIMLTSTGAKLLDFGLAKPASPLASTAMPTALTKDSIATEQGTIVGTFQYMSPEQVEGKELDGRSDIFSLGAVLYEMLTGKRAFEGKSQLSVASAILEKEPAPISTVKPLTPPALDHAVKKCLAKLPDERWQSASDLASELKWAVESGSQSGVPARLNSIHKMRWAVLAILTLFAFGIGFAAKTFLTNSPEAKAPVVRFDIPMTPGASNSLVFLILDRGVAISPDGTRIIFRVPSTSATHLFLRNINSPAIVELAGTEGAIGPFFSPDGQSIAFFAGGKLKKLALSGGGPSILCEAHTLGSTGTWSSNGNIYFSSLSTLLRVPAHGGTPERIGAEVSGILSNVGPVALPGGQTLLSTVWDGASFDSWRIESVRLDTGERRTVLRNGFSPRFVAPRYLLFVRDADLYAVEFDPKQLETHGEPVRILEGVQASAAYGTAQYDVSNDGNLVYFGGTALGQQNHLVWRDRSGKPEDVALPANTYQAPRISPDGREVALTVRMPDPDIWIYSVGRGTLRRVSFTPGEDEVAAWSPDGKRLAYSSNSRKQLSWVPVDGSSGEERLAPIDTHVHIGSWSRDGKLLVFESFGETSNREIWVLPLEGDRKAYPYLHTNFDYRAPALSPDGHWLAYQSDESGRPEIYVQKFPGPGEKTQISTEGGTSPVWSRDGRELFYRNGDKQMTVNISTQTGFSAGNPRALFESPTWTLAGPNYDVTPDGKRFISVEARMDEAVRPIRVVLNWMAEVADQVAVQKR